MLFISGNLRCAHYESRRVIDFPLSGFPWQIIMEIIQLHIIILI